MSAVVWALGVLTALAFTAMFALFYIACFGSDVALNAGMVTMFLTVILGGATIALGSVDTP